MWWQILLGMAGGLVILWLVMLGVLWSAQRGHPDKARLRDALRLIPDVVRLLRRLAADPALPRGVRVRLWLLLIYLILPIDLIPDFIPGPGLRRRCDHRGHRDPLHRPHRRDRCPPRALARDPRGPQRLVHCRRPTAPMTGARCPSAQVPKSSSMADRDRALRHRTRRIHGG